MAIRRGIAKQRDVSAFEGLDACPNSICFEFFHFQSREVKFGNDELRERGEPLLESGGELDSGRKGGGDDAQEMHLCRAESSQLTHDKHFLDTDLMRGKLHGDAVLQEVLFGVAVAGSRLARQIQSVHDVNAPGLLQLVSDQETERAAVKKLHFGGEPVVLLQMADEMNAESLVREQDVPDPENQCFHQAGLT